MADVKPVFWLLAGCLCFYLRICTSQLYAAFHCLCPFLLCWLPGDLECQPCLAHAADAVTTLFPPITGALLQLGSPNNLVGILAAVSVLIATINIVGGSMVTRRMLAMFQKS